MAVMQHPLFSDVTHTVADADVSTWQKQGWVRTDTSSRTSSSRRAQHATTDSDTEPAPANTEDDE